MPISANILSPSMAAIDSANFMCPSYTAFMLFWAVSYTHLDVYKRQALLCRFVEFSMQSGNEIEKLAVVMDVRGGEEYGLSLIHI